MKIVLPVSRPFPVEHRGGILPLELGSSGLLEGRAPGMAARVSFLHSLGVSVATQTLKSPQNNLGRVFEVRHCHGLFLLDKNPYFCKYRSYDRSPKQEEH
jgi:hypothetical protein